MKADDRTNVMVLLIGNYAPERQQSMLRFATMMLDGLAAAGLKAELLQPQPLFGKFTAGGAFLAKWLAYVDKFLIFPSQLKTRLRRGAAIVHICDHSNAIYAKRIHSVPVVVTCHDLLAVRGGLGEATDCPASFAGKILQRWIVSGLRSAAAVPCDSFTTRQDAERIVTGGRARPKLPVITLGQSYDYRLQPIDEARARARSVLCFDPAEPFLLHVGSNLRRKNREGILRIFARVEGRWPGRLVFAGDALSEALRGLAESLGITDRIVEVVGPDNATLEALYNCATAFIFPSRFEGFGWPIIEAQACGCPVLTSATNPMAEVAGAGALLRDPSDEPGFAEDLLSLGHGPTRERWRAAALENAKRFTTERMIAEYRKLYRSLTPAC